MEFYKIDHEVTLEDIKKFNYPNQRLAMIVHFEDDQGRILLQQRGTNSRDENGLYETIGGKFEEEDLTFKNAILREIKEEVGTEMNFTLSDSIGIYHCKKKDTNWIFIIYFGQYIDGKINVMEPTKCQGYKFFTYEEVLNSDLVTEGTKYLTKSIKKHRKI